MNHEDDDDDDVKRRLRIEVLHFQRGPRDIEQIHLRVARYEAKPEMT